MAEAASSKLRRLKLTEGRDDYMMVAAIDFGTTFSGYAFSFKSSKDNIIMNKNWGAGAGFQSYKTPTCILLGPNEEFKAFGFEAESQYAEMDEEEQGSHMFFNRFKMALHKNKHLSRKTLISSTNGVLKPATEIFSMSIRYLKDHLLKAISDQTSTAPDMEYIRWVITVPAIWSDSSKQFMREAACKAGLITRVTSDRLMIALEPEAASIHCRTLEFSHFVGETGTGTMKMGAGTKYMVLDAGGGTVDVTVHEVESTGKVKEIHQATGGAWGGTKVDDNFISLLEQVFGEDFIKKYRKANCTPH